MGDLFPKKGSMLFPVLPSSDSVSRKGGIGSAWGMLGSARRSPAAAPCAEAGEEQAGSCQLLPGFPGSRGWAALQHPASPGAGDTAGSGCGPGTGQFPFQISISLKGSSCSLTPTKVL